jgi:Icc-related predicted phosphoesterase
MRFKAGLPNCLFATDLHGRIGHYERLCDAITSEHPAAVFLAGDLLPTMGICAEQSHASDFLHGCIAPMFTRVRKALGSAYPEVFLILGNDDPRWHEQSLRALSAQGLWQYAQGRKLTLTSFSVYGYACVPPSPFLLKDWERYDVSRYVSPGCVSPEEGRRSVAVEDGEVKWATIHRELESLAGDDHLDRAIFLLHCPPYDTALDRAALDGKMHEHVPLDLHVGSIAVRRFIEARQPFLTLHGHVHESTRLTGEWKIQLGRTVCINGAHEGPELALVRFNLESPWEATRELI